MEFDDYTVTLLLHNPDGPRLDETEAAAMQDKHMGHIADLADLGHLVAAGPVFDETYRGLSILTVSPQEALELNAADPAARAGIHSEGAPLAAPHRRTDVQTSPLSPLSRRGARLSCRETPLPGDAPGRGRQRLSDDTVEPFGRGRRRRGDLASMHYLSEDKRRGLGHEHTQQRCRDARPE